MANKTQVLDTASSSQSVLTPSEPIWSFGAVLIGAFGVPAIWLFDQIYQNWLPPLLISSAALLYLFAGRQKFLVSENPRQRSRVSRVGAVLILLWAPLFLILPLAIIIKSLIRGHY